MDEQLEEIAASLLGQRLPQRLEKIRTGHLHGIGRMAGSFAGT